MLQVLYWLLLLFCSLSTYTFNNELAVLCTLCMYVCVDGDVLVALKLFVIVVPFCSRSYAFAVYIRWLLLRIGIYTRIWLRRRRRRKENLFPSLQLYRALHCSALLCYVMMFLFLFVYCSLARLIWILIRLHERVSAANAIALSCLFVRSLALFTVYLSSASLYAMAYGFRIECWAQYSMWLRFVWTHINYCFAVSNANWQKKEREKNW